MFLWRGSIPVVLRLQLRMTSAWILAFLDDFQEGFMVYDTAESVLQVRECDQSSSEVSGFGIRAVKL
jgi:hypothetical protein